MSFVNFKPEIWSKTLINDRDKTTIGVQNSWRQFEGDIKEMGDRVHIQGLKGATIKDIPANGVLDDPEIVQDSEMELIIDQKKYANFGMPDIDKAQMNVSAMQAIIGKTGNNLAVTQDQFVYSLAKAGAAKTLDYTTTKLTSKTIINAVSQALAYIKSTNASAKVFFEWHPMAFQKMQLSLLTHTMPNDSAFKNGYNGDFLGGGMYEAQSIPYDDGNGNAIAVDDANAVFYCIARTQEAIAYAEQKTMNFEPFRVEKGFEDGLKGFCLYGGKVVRPSELVLIKCKVDYTETF